MDRMPCGIIRLVIAEDQKLIRQGLAALLNDSSVEVIGEAEDGVAAIEMARLTVPDVILMDLSMPSLDGIEATRQIKKELPSVRVLILTGSNGKNRIAEALAAGADGYASKSLSQGELLTAIGAVHAGNGYLAPGIKIESADDRNGDDAFGIPLTAREREVVKLIARGVTNKAIAATLSIAVKTVETHRMKIMRKLDLHSAADIATYAVRRGLIE